jgi:hypothetical protein
MGESASVLNGFLSNHIHNKTTISRQKTQAMKTFWNILRVTSRAEEPYFSIFIIAKFSKMH